MNKIAFACLLLLLCFSGFAQTRKISGQVIDDKNEPIMGVSVAQKGTANGTATDMDGNYTLTIPDSDSLTLEIKYIGYKSQEVAVGSQSTVNVTLVEDIAITEEVVVIGYGTVKKSDLTGSVASIKPDEVKQVPSANVMESIQGKAPGVDIVRTSGSTSEAPAITVRGNRSIRADNNPLYIVDGMQYSSIQDINPADIVSMEVLKDASSTAIYGSRGSNGVIIVTTKKGAAGEIKVSVNSYIGQSSVLAFPKALGPQGYLDLKRQSLRTDDADKGLGDNPNLDAQNPKVTQELQNLQNGYTTDYVKELLHKGLQKDLQVGISGGTEKLKAYFSLDYYNEQGMLRNDELKRYTGRLNLDYQVKKYLKVGCQTQITNYDQSYRANPINRALSFVPLTRPFDENGNYVNAPSIIPGTPGVQANPLIDERVNAAVDKKNTLRIFPTIYAEATLLKGLTSRFNFALNRDTDKRLNFQDAGSMGRTTNATSFSRFEGNYRTSFNWQAILNYGFNIKKAHSFNVTALNEIVTYKKEFFNAQGEGQLIPDQLYYNLAANPEKLVIGSSYEATRLVSFAGRVNYTLLGRYLFTVTGRSDGASQLSDGKKWDFFPSVAAAWRISDEKFMGPIKTISNLKLRGSWGIAGNASVKPYQTQSVLYQVPVAVGETPVPAYRYSALIGNDNLRWEKSKTIDVGLDLGLLNERITFTADYYITKTSNLILDRALPPSSGVERTVENVGKTENKGVELALTSVNVSKKKFTWSTTITFMKNKERVTELVGGVDKLQINRDGNLEWIVVGAPVNTFYNYEKVGIWQLDQQEEMAKYNSLNATKVKAGEVKIKDQNGDGVIDVNDRIVVGSRVPKFSAGLNSECKFYNFDVNLYFFARVGQTINYASPYDPFALGNSIDSRQYWTPENPTNDLPRPGRNINNEFRSAVNYMDGSFYKLRSATIGYTIPARLVQKFKIDRLRIYVTGKNLFVLSKIKNYDSEMAGGIEAPSVRLVLIGANLEF